MLIKAGPDVRSQILFVVSVCDILLTFESMSHLSTP